MKSILRSTAILGGSSAITILIGLVTSKAWALLLGPTGVGFMGLVQSVLGLTNLVAGMGIGAGLVRAGAHALANEGEQEFVALQQAAYLLICIFSGIATLGLLLFRIPVSIWMLGGAEHSNIVAVMGLAVYFGLVSGVQVSLLNAYHRVTALAQIAIATSVVNAIISLLFIWQWREQGIMPALIGGAIAGWLVTYLYLRHYIEPLPHKATKEEVTRGAKSLLKFGLPYTSSMIVGTGVQYAIPLIIFNILGQESVGFYRAAIAISIGYMGFLLNAMAQDYYPRISAVSTDAIALTHLINQQLKLILLLVTPIIIGALGLTSVLISLIYSPEFLQAKKILEWQLIGNLFKFASWTMSFVILAKCGSKVYFFTELIAGAVWLASSYIGLRMFGLTGLGVSFLITYIIYYWIVLIVLREEIQFKISTSNKLYFLGAVITVSGIQVLPLLGLGDLQIPAALALATLAGFLSGYILFFNKSMGDRDVQFN